jgi:hypothetical protein
MESREYPIEEPSFFIGAEEARQINLYRRSVADFAVDSDVSRGLLQP